MGVIQKILEANRTRSIKNVERRMLKLVEEVGETAEALLGATSANNYKGKSFDDVREELVDCLILVLDILLTPMPDQKKMSDKERREMIHGIVDAKLAKWAGQRAKQKVADDA